MLNLVEMPRQILSHLKGPLLQGHMFTKDQKEKRAHFSELTVARKVPGGQGSWLLGFGVGKLFIQTSCTGFKPWEPNPRTAKIKGR